MDENPNAQGTNGAPPHRLALRIEERRSIRRQSRRAGLCVLAFLILEYILIRALVYSETLYGLYWENEAVRGLTDMFFYLVCMLVPFLVAYRTMRPEDKDALTLFGPPVSKLSAVAAIVAGFLVCNAANYLTNVLLSLMEDAGFSVGGGVYDTPQTPIQLVFSILNIGLLPAFAEEFALRGVVMQPLRRHGDLFAILMSAFVFALMHGNLSQFAFAFLVGAAIGYFVVATGSVWVGVAIHILNNVYSVVLNYLLDARPTAAETLYDLELSITLVVGIISIVLFLTVCRRNKLKKTADTLTGGEKTAMYLLTLPMIVSIIWLIADTVRLISFEG